MAENNDLKQKYDTLRAERKKIEGEIGEIDEQLRAAVQNADAPRMIALKERKATLPEIYIRASAAEYAAASAYYLSNRDDAMQRCREAEDAAIEAELQLETYKIESAKKLNELTMVFQKSKERVAVLQGEVKSWSAESYKNSDGYQRALQKLAGVSV